MANAVCEIHHYHASGSINIGLGTAPSPGFQNLLSGVLSEVGKTLLPRGMPREELLVETNAPRLPAWC